MNKSTKIDQDCYCYTCGVYYNHMGIARHRAMHRDKNENCDIVYSTGKRFEHRYETASKMNKPTKKELKWARRHLLNKLILDCCKSVIDRAKKDKK